MHDGHRMRLKTRFQKTGLEGFAEHEILELILFYAIPRQDTNPLAHALIDHFGSLYAVLSADINDLTEVKGIGENAASLIRLFKDVSKHYYSKAYRPRSVETSEKAAKYILSLLYGKRNENFYLICLDANYHILYEELMCEGSIDTIPVFPRKIAACALRHNAASIIIAHNHPAGDPKPSKADIQATLDIVQAIKPLGIQLSDHIIVAGDEYYSFSDTLTHQSALEEAPLAYIAQTPGPAQPSKND